jgi:TatD DNase family protein
MHCFTGDAAHALRCVTAGFAISFSGIVTFTNAAPIQEAARAVGAGDLVVETDAPFLTPVPHRGSLNLPERVAVTAAAVAGLRGVPEAMLREQTTANAVRLFSFGGLDGDRLG